MFDPEMMRMAQEAMSRMSPEQIAAMQRQAANMGPAQMQQAMSMVSGMTPEQRRAATESVAQMNPETLAQQASGAQAQLSAQRRYQYRASLQLKNEGNRLHATQQYEAAAEKYQRAVNNLAGNTTADSVALSTSCQSNLASCYLQLRRWQDCAAQCDTVLASDPASRKALYRRGQALAALGRPEPAVHDLQRALELSPEAEKGVIREKLEEARQAAQQAAQGFVIEEVDGAGSDADSDEDMPSLEAMPGAGVRPPPPPTATAASVGEMAGMGAEQEALAAEMMRRDPSVVKHAAEMMSGMSDAELTASMAQAGGAMMPGMTPEMARAAASMMNSMPPEHIKAMAAATGAAPAPSASPFGGGSIAERGKLAAEAMRQDPAAFKNAAKMMEQMGPEQLDAMAKMMPGAPPGMKIDAEQVKRAAKMMESMSPEEFELMSQMAQSMGVGSGGDVLAAEPAATPAAAGTRGAEPSTAAAAAAAPGDSVPPMLNSSCMDPDMMANMRRQMADPAMLRSMQSMLKGMDPQTLSSMMKATGMQMEPEQAAKMVEQMVQVSDRQMLWLARLAAAVNFVIDAYQRARAWAMSNGALALALVVLAVALLLRWRGWF